MEEAVYHGVPVLAVPLSADQYGNAQRTISLGIGDRFYWDEFTEEEVLAKIDKLLRDPKYKNRVKQLSELFRDRPMDIVENAVYWMEYVMRTGGAHHLKTDAKEFSFAQYFLLDVIGFIGLGVTVTLAVLVFAICRIIRFLKKTLLGDDQHPRGKVLQAKKNK